jgi:hypothetical protein
MPTDLPSDAGRALGDGAGESSAPADALALDAGVQALVRMPSMRSPLAVLPSAAFENLLVVSATRSPGAVERQVHERGGDPERVGVVPVSGSPVDYDGPMWTSDAVTPADLSGISDRVARAARYVKPGVGWVVFDNVNVPLMYADRSGVYGLVRSVAARSRDRHARGVFSVVPGALATSTYDSLEDALDLTVDRTGDDP